MEVEPLLEASGKRNWRSIILTHDEFPCHCLLQTLWYPERSNLVLIWDSGELLSMGLPDSSRPITIVIVGVMMAIRWLEAHVRENNRQEAPTREIPGKYLCFLVTRATEKQHMDPENLVLSLTRLRDFLVEMDVKELSLPVYDSNRGRLHTRELYALVQVIFSDTNIQVYIHKKYYLSIG